MTDQTDGKAVGRLADEEMCKVLTDAADSADKEHDAYVMWVTPEEARNAASLIAALQAQVDTLAARAEKAEGHAEAGWAQVEYWQGRYTAAADEREAALAQIGGLRRSAKGAG